MIKRSREFHDLKTELKSFILESKMIYFPDWNAPVEIHTDASKQALGGFAFQRGPNGEIRPIAYVSRSVKDAEKVYYDLVHKGTGFDVRELELLAVIWVLDELNYFLRTTKGVTLHTDHRNILWLKKQGREGSMPTSKGNDRLLRWALKLDQ